MPNFDPAILKLFNKFRNKEPLYKVASGILQRAVEENWRSQGERLGGTWPQLSRAYLKQKSKRKKSIKILQSSGAAIRSLNRIHGNDFASVSLPPATARYMITHVLGLTINYPARNRELNFKVNSESGLSRFSKKSKANFQQNTMSKAYSIKFKQRDPFKLTEEDYKKIENKLWQFIIGKL